VRYARSGDVDFIKRIESSSFNGFVHSIFNKTLNIQTLENGELYTIACQEIDNGPNTLVIQLDRFNDLDLAINEAVFVNDHVLNIANKLAISIGNADKWESVLSDYPKNTDILYKNLFKMKEYISINGVDGGMKGSSKTTSPFEAEMFRMLEESSDMLLNEMIKNRMSESISHSIKLVGLGPGLTPSGDDFLVGLFTILNVNKSPYYSYRALGEEVVQKAKKLTNDISFMALKKASQGQVRESISGLVHSVFYGSEQELIFSLKNVLKIGSSSGTDIALGIVCGLEANIKAGGKV
jgi:hypothetical protein